MHLKPPVRVPSRLRRICVQSGSTSRPPDLGHEERAEDRRREGCTERRQRSPSRVVRRPVLGPSTVGDPRSEASTHDNQCERRTEAGAGHGGYRRDGRPLWRGRLVDVAGFDDCHTAGTFSGTRHICRSAATASPPAATRGIHHHSPDHHAVPASPKKRSMTSPVAPRYTKPRTPPARPRMTATPRRRRYQAEPNGSISGPHKSALIRALVWEGSCTLAFA